jgi:hypothetical protein
MTSGCDNAPERSTINGYMAGTAAIVLGQSATNPQLLQPI